MGDSTTTIQHLKEACRQFVAERDWQQFHSPKNLAMGLAVEAAELMEHFLWATTDESREMVKEPQKFADVAEEIADVVVFSLCLCNALNLDLSSTIEAKLKKNAQKYPAEQYRGKYHL